MSDESGKFDQWANVEIMGHRRFAGLVSEEVIAGQGFIRIDVPQIGDRMAFTKLIGPSSIYAITPVSKAVALDLAASYSAKPVDVYSPSVQRALPEYNDNDDERDW